MDRPAPVTDCRIHLLDQRSRPCISAGRHPIGGLITGTVQVFVAHAAPLSLLSSGGAPSMRMLGHNKNGKRSAIEGTWNLPFTFISTPCSPPPPPPPPQSGSYLPPSGHSEGWSHMYQREFSLTAGIFRCMARHAVTALS